MTAPVPDPLDARAEALFREHRDENYRRTSRLFAILMLVQWMAGVLIAVVYSPYAWEGRESSVHAHVWIAIFLGGLISSLPIFLALTRPAADATRYAVAIGQMMWSAVLIHLTGGRIETHFHVFGSLAFLAFYRDWKVLLPATIVVATDHLARQMFWPQSVFGVLDPAWWRFLEHAMWVIFEDIVLVASCLVAVDEMRRNARSHATVEDLAAREARAEELRRTHEALAAAQGAQARAEKLAAVGQLAASVSHELRNPLAAVRNANAYIGKKLKANGAGGGDARVLQFNALIERELDVCTKIIGDLLDFARDRPLVVAPTSLHHLAAAAIALVPEHKVEIRNRIADDLPMAMIDPDQFRQVLINLTQNAAEAMEARGHGAVTIDAARQGGGFALTIEDDGPGIAEDVAANIFEPMFTTKVKGTGLGLAIVAGIVKRHHGTIEVDSQIGRGTRFVIQWPDPVAKVAPAPGPRAAAPSPVAAGAE